MTKVIILIILIGSIIGCIVLYKKYESFNVEYVDENENIDEESQIKTMENAYGMGCAYLKN